MLAKVLASSQFELKSREKPPDYELVGIGKIDYFVNSSRERSNALAKAVTVDKRGSCRVLLYRIFCKLVRGIFAFLANAEKLICFALQCFRILFASAWCNPMHHSITPYIQLTIHSVERIVEIIWQA